MRKSFVYRIVSCMFGIVLLILMLFPIQSVKKSHPSVEIFWNKQELYIVLQEHIVLYKGGYLPFYIGGVFAIPYGRTEHINIIRWHLKDGKLDSQQFANLGYGPPWVWDSQLYYLTSRTLDGCSADYNITNNKLVKLPCADASHIDTVVFNKELLRTSGWSHISYIQLESYLGTKSFPFEIDGKQYIFMVERHMLTNPTSMSVQYRLKWPGSTPHEQILYTIGQIGEDKFISNQQYLKK